MTNGATDRPNRKVFISYSRKSEMHIDWVERLGERLMADGVNVILDLWDLKDGQDLNSFMEQMVHDSTIDRVIIISESSYASKADARMGGVGTETLIISPEVYESVDQIKFIPIVCERDSAGQCFLPVFLKGRKYIDFCNPVNDAEPYEQLLRNIFDRPLRRKPALGNAPSHIFEEENVSLASAQKSKRFIEFVVSGRGNANLAFEDFASSFLDDMNQLRMTYSYEAQGDWCDQIRENIHRGTAHRDVLVDVVRAGVHLSPDQFIPRLLTFLERLLTLRNRPSNVNSGFDVSEDNYQFFNYEFFLYTFAILVQNHRWMDARRMLDHMYVIPDKFSSMRSHDFRTFNSYVRSLEEKCSTANGLRRYSVTADLIHDRATNKHVRFSDVLQVDVILAIASGGHGWFPRCLVYGNDCGKLELMVRAESELGFEPLRILLKTETPRDFVLLMESEDINKVFSHHMFAFMFRSSDCLNLDELRRRWRPRSN